LPVLSVPFHPALAAMPPCNATVIAVAVTYHPEAETLERQLAALAPQVARMIVVDNGSRDEDLAPARAANAEVIGLGRNLGLAAAQNRGIERALAAGATHVLLMDQDSVPMPGMVDRLLAAHALPASRPVAAVGPRAFDPRSGTSLDHLVRRGWRFCQRPTPETAAAPLVVEHLIASGCLISASALEKIGAMDESLFIDAVDIEWCMRARAAGFRLLLETRAVLEHRLGRHGIRLRTGTKRVRTLALHSPMRQYYIFRNNLLLCRRPYVDRAWWWLMLKVLPRRFAFYLIFGPERAAFLRAMLTGVRDAWRGQGGERR
jgi:rhamnosyltransferase